MSGTFWNALEHRAVRFVPTLAAALVGAGCAGTPQYTRVNVPVPVECKEVVPDRPAMPTESLATGAAPWVLLRAALSEIDRREAYEIKMRAALAACTAPLVAGP
ncbi:hypothetical protein [Acidovorax sp. Root568]|uniref:hypothetical protein n=1 Tax=Acidovorax sp. Root568 TaxID=1736565 RepID=UPI0006FC29CF|nr:hypothetical protein [Acidovorax sp. Root568]KRA13965.1 hypothetical protein ASD75_04695 [Acidovorax sp. Root568]